MRRATPRPSGLTALVCSAVWLAAAACGGGGDSGGDGPGEDLSPGAVEGPFEADRGGEGGLDLGGDGGGDGGGRDGGEGTADGAMGTADAETPVDATPPPRARVLFDIAHGQTAGNADWVIDRDGGRFPSPAEPTDASQWSGGNSAFGYELHRAGYRIEQLPAGESFTYGTPAAQDLTGYDVVVAVEPNTAYSAVEQQALRAFVLGGGGLLMVADHIVSDRDGDGIDSVGIWNAVLQVEPGPSAFGLRFNADDLTLDLSVVSEDPRASPLLSGPFGQVRALHLYRGCTLAVTEPAFALVSGEAFGLLQIGAAAAEVGAGRVVAIGDSTPTSDGSGEGLVSGFPWYDGRYSHRALFLNATAWLARTAP